MSIIDIFVIVSILVLIYNIYDLSKSNKILKGMYKKIETLKVQVEEINSIEIEVGKKYIIVEPKEYSKILKKGENPFEPLKTFEIEVLDIKDGFVKYTLFDMYSEYGNMFTEMSADILSVRKGIYYHTQYKKSKEV